MKGSTIQRRGINMEKEPVSLKRYKDVYYNEIEERVYVEVYKESKHILFGTHVDKILAEIALPKKEAGLTFEEYVLSHYDRITQSIPSESTEYKTEIYNESIFVKFTNGTIMEFRHTPSAGEFKLASITF